MPLIVVCGLPSSGKSTRAKELGEHFEKMYSTEIVQDESTEFDFNRNSLYADSMKERQFRDALKSKLQKCLSNENVVILDALNYVGGFRYELYCLSKLAKTTMCTVFCDVPQEECMLWNRDRPREEMYPEDIFHALVQRFEVPDSRNRWESPLFIACKGRKLPFEDINRGIFSRKAPPPNLSTQAQPISSGNFVNQLNKRTKETVEAIIQGQKVSGPGSYITVPGTSEKILLVKPLTASELSKMRKEFLAFSRTQTFVTESIVTTFVEYIKNRSACINVFPSIETVDVMP